MIEKHLNLYPRDNNDFNGLPFNKKLSFINYPLMNNMNMKIPINYCVSHKFTLSHYIFDIFVYKC